MKLGVAELEQLPWVVRTAMEDLEVAIQAGWGTEHQGDGSHGAISGTSMAVTGNSTVGGLFRWGTQLWGSKAGVITPAQITANTNNYSPPDFTACWKMRLSTDASRNLTGLAAPTSNPDGHFRFILLHNVGSQNLVLIHNNTSTITNRFACPGSGNLTLNSGDSAWTHYDTQGGNWVVEGT